MTGHGRIYIANEGLARCGGNGGPVGYMVLLARLRCTVDALKKMT